LFELRLGQFRWNPLPRLPCRHFSRQNIRSLSASHGQPEITACSGFQTNSLVRKTRNQYVAQFLKAEARLLARYAFQANIGADAKQVAVTAHMEAVSCNGLPH